MLSTNLMVTEIFDGQNLQIAISNGLSRAKNFYGNLREFEEDLKSFERLFEENFDKLFENEIKNTGYVATIAGVFYGLEQIPKNWLDALKKKDYLTQVATDFYNTFKGEKN